MNRSALILAVVASQLLGCAATVPLELANARQAYEQASVGPAATLVPAELHKADLALKEAEAAFDEDPKGYHTLDLAYVAQRKAELAMALAASATEELNETAANARYQTTQDAIMVQTREQLGESQADLAATQVTAAQTQAQLAAAKTAGAQTEAQLAAAKTAGAQTEAQLAAAKTAGAAAAASSTAALATSEAARKDAEARAAEATAALAKLAAVREEARGLVITLSGSVLFRSNEATLLPEAQVKLGQVADALLATKERSLLIEGHTDSQGSDAHNMDLALRRAEAVRSFLGSRGYDTSRIRSAGIGESRPIADNNTAEGRANNRRVEIVIEPMVASSGN